MLASCALFDFSPQQCDQLESGDDLEDAVVFTEVRDQGENSTDWILHMIPSDCRERYQNERIIHPTASELAAYRRD
ncbi:hypothetical protein E2P81_ATG08557 [Venturia nashicola]|nr:hypothetical protein E2P81_ATG08557 [Venturia nashicola]